MILHNFDGQRVTAAACDQGAAPAPSTSCRADCTCRLPGGAGLLLHSAYVQEEEPRAHTRPALLFDRLPDANAKDKILLVVFVRESIQLRAAAVIAMTVDWIYVVLSKAPSQGTIVAALEQCKKMRFKTFTPFAGAPDWLIRDHLWLHFSPFLTTWPVPLLPWRCLFRLNSLWLCDSENGAAFTRQGFLWRSPDNSSADLGSSSPSRKYGTGLWNKVLRRGLVHLEQCKYIFASSENVQFGRVF